MRALTCGLFALAMSFSPASQAATTLIGSEFSGSDFFEIDAGTGDVTNLGISRNFATGLEIDEDANELIVLEFRGGLEVRDLDDFSVKRFIDFPPGFSDFRGLAFNQDATLLYTLGFERIDSRTVGAIYSIDPATGQTQLVQSNLPSTCCAIAVDSAGLVVVGDLGGRITTFDPSRGFLQLSSVVIPGLREEAGVTALAFDADDRLFGIRTTSDELAEIDLSDNSITVLTQSFGNDVTGLVALPPPPPVTPVDPPSVVPVPPALGFLIFGVLALFGVGRARRS